MIEYDGQIVGRLPGDPVVDPEEFGRLRALLAGRRAGRRPEGRVFSPRGCGGCGKGLTGCTQYEKSGRQRRRYRCTKRNGGCGGLNIDSRGTDAVLREFVITRLSDSEHAAAIGAARAQVAERLAELRAEIAECEKLQEALADRLGRREMK